MNKSVFHVLQLILDDISKNYSQFNESDLIKAISQFQNKVLNSRKQDPELRIALQKLSMKQISEISNGLNISLLSPPKQRKPLASLMNSLILQTRKKEDFLHLIKPILSVKPKSITKPKRKQKVTISANDYHTYCKKWLISAYPNQLEPELNSINMNELRRIVEPWRVKPKGRYKKDLIEAIIDYIVKIKRLSKLGT